MEQNSLSSKEDVEKITWFGYQSFIFSLIRALTISIGSYIMFSVSQVDTHISSFIGIIIAIIPFGMFLQISKNKYELDIIDLNIKLFGKVFGNILNTIVNIIFILISSLILYYIAQYIDIQYIPNTSSLYVQILIIMPVIYAATKNIATITRISQVILFLNIGIYVISILGLIEEFKIDNLLPVFEMDITSILHSAFIFAISISVPIFLMTIIPQSKVVKKEYNSKKMFIIFLVFGLMLIFTIIATLLILGVDIINIYRYPIFMALRQFSLFTIIERVERFLSLQFIADVIVFLILSIYFISSSLNKIVKFKQKNILAYVISFVILLISTFLFKDGIKVNEWVNNYYIYLLSLGILLPMTITFIGVMVDKFKGYINKDV